LGIAIVSKICIIQFSEGDKWKAQAQSHFIKFDSIEAVRGNIYDANGSLLATSLPYFETGIDINADAITKDVFDDNVDSLSFCLSKLFKDKTNREYKNELIKARKSHDRWLVLQRDVSYSNLQKMKTFPLLRKGKNKGGFVYLQTNKRERPFQFLASRTIGKLNDNGTGKSYGLEIAYDSILEGKNGHRWIQKIAGNIWRPVNDANEIDPEDGEDIVTTIDINVQDVAENSLLNCLRKHGADHGCLILMEVKTGEIKAIANLTRSNKDTSKYFEDLNYGVGAATEPGSTFKLASLISVMEDGYADLNEVVDIEDGTHQFADRVMKDSHHPEESKITLQKVFELSSNVGVSKIITRYYSKEPQKFIDHLIKMNLGSSLNTPIPGEAPPYIKTTKDRSWSNTSLPWMSIGYELLVSPLQTLTFYNAVANNGVMVRPMFVKEVRNHGKTVKTFASEIINPAICSQSTIRKAKTMMEGVVLNGTGKTLKNANYQIAGKTGTAQQAKKGGNYKTGGVTYQASFVGYFPADNPKYSCIVIVSAPTGDAYYGGVVAGPVFKDVADKVYSTSTEIHKEINSDKSIVSSVIPSTKNGEQEEIQNVLSVLKIKSKTKNSNAEWVSVSNTDSSSVSLTPQSLEENLKNNIVPNLLGLSAKDVLFLLENKNMIVKIQGSGSVVSQSIPAGTSFTKGTPIILHLM
jgi:cell division protein FtsI (penicillin-binding protein 3)